MPGLCPRAFASVAAMSTMSTNHISVPWRCLLLAALCLPALGCKEKESPPPPTKDADGFAQCESALHAATDKLRSVDPKDEAAIQEVFFTSLRACGKVYREEKCRAAWEGLPTNGSQEEKRKALRAAAQTCREIYCPLVSAASSGGCDGGTGDWRSMRAAVLTRELGREKADALEKIIAENMRLGWHRDGRRRPPPPPPGAPGGGLTLTITKDGVTLSTAAGNVGPGCEGTAAGVTVPMLAGAGADKNAAPAIDKKALAACARKLKDGQLSTSSSVHISASKDMPYGLVSDCIDAVRRDERGELFPEVMFSAARD